MYIKELQQEQVELESAKCPFDLCDGNGVIPREIYDADSKELFIDGTEPCLCDIDKRDDTYVPPNEQ